MDQKALFIEFAKTFRHLQPYKMQGIAFKPQGPPGQLGVPANGWIPVEDRHPEFTLGNAMSMSLSKCSVGPAF